MEYNECTNMSGIVARIAKRPIAISGDMKNSINDA